MYYYMYAALEYALKSYSMCDTQDTGLPSKVYAIRYTTVDNSPECH